MKVALKSGTRTPRRVFNVISPHGVVFDVTFSAIITGKKHAKAGTDRNCKKLLILLFLSNFYSFSYTTYIFIPLSMVFYINEEHGNPGIFCVTAFALFTYDFYVLNLYQEESICHMIQINNCTFSCIFNGKLFFDS